MDEDRVTLHRVTTDTANTPSATRSVVDEQVTHSPSGAAVLRRLVLFIFGLMQLAIGLRIILLALDADRANGLVSGIYSVSAPLVAPFEGILRTDAIHASGSVFDVAAIVALVGWTILEIVVVATTRIGSREL